MPRVIAFDVNETLLDLRALDPLFGDVARRKRWFAQMLQIAFVGIITDQYIGFADAAAGRAGDAGRGRRPGRGGGGDAERCRCTPTSAPALDRLREGGLTLCSLTNSSLETSTAQLDPRRHRRPLRGDPLRRHRAAAQARAGALPPRGGDVRGRDRRRHARRLPRVGLRGRARGGRAGRVRAQRPGMVLGPVGARPGIVGDDLGEVASLILA